MPHSEFNEVVGLLAMFRDWRIGILTLLLAAAAVTDCRSRRIPNWLVLSGAVFGVAYNTLFPPSIQDNIFFPLAGIGVSLMLFFPLYLLRAMSAGDVKLMAMVGAFLGPGAALQAALASTFAGGVLAILLVVVSGNVRRLCGNLISLFHPGFPGFVGWATPGLRIAEGASVGKMPYAVAIAAGTVGYLVWRQIGG